MNLVFRCLVFRWLLYIILTNLAKYLFQLQMGLPNYIILSNFVNYLYQIQMGSEDWVHLNIRKYLQNNHLICGNLNTGPRVLNSGPIILITGVRYLPIHTTVVSSATLNSIIKYFCRVQKGSEYWAILSMRKMHSKNYLYSTYGGNLNTWPGDLNTWPGNLNTGPTIIIWILGTMEVGYLSIHYTKNTSFTREEIIKYSHFSLVQMGSEYWALSN